MGVKGRAGNYETDIKKREKRNTKKTMKSIKQDWKTRNWPQELETMRKKKTKSEKK